jgi:hypothetical protein
MLRIIRVVRPSASIWVHQNVPFRVQLCILCYPRWKSDVSFALSLVSVGIATTNSCSVRTTEQSKVINSFGKAELVDSWICWSFLRSARLTFQVFLQCQLWCWTLRFLIWSYSPNRRIFLCIRPLQHEARSSFGTELTKLFCAMQNDRLRQ